MTLVSIELSDAGIIAAGGTPAEILPVDGRNTTSPGFALQDGHRLIVGCAAAEQSRLFPQQINSRFWDQLDTQPIVEKAFTAANHAELAYEHLRQIWSVLGPLDAEVIFSVPGHFSRDSLGLLLGITRELNIDVRGFMPIALTAATPAATGEIIHIDLHLQRCEVTYLKQDTELVQLDTTSASDAGLENLYRTWTQTAAREFLQATRFDLLHSAASEQEVHRHLRPLLATLTDHQTVRFEMNTGEHNYHMVLQRRAMVAAAQPIYTQIADRVTTLVQRNRLLGHRMTFQLSHRASRLPGLKDQLAPFGPADIEDLVFGAAALGAAHCWPALSALNADRGPSRHLRRPVVDPATTDGTDAAHDGSQPTHLLFGDTAYPIGLDPLVIGSAPGAGIGDIQLAGGRVSARHCSVQCAGKQILLDNHSPYGTRVDGIIVMERTVLSIGQTIVVGEPGGTLRLIQCLPAQ